MTDPFATVAVRRDALWDNGIPDSVPRDRWGRPLIMQPDDSLAPYVRVSTLAQTLTDQTGLTIWKTRSVALAVARDPALAAVLAGCDYSDPGLDPLIEQVLDRRGATASVLAEWLETVTDDRTRADLARRLNRARAADAAAHGTAVHAWTDHACTCGVRRAVSPDQADDVAAFDEAMDAAGLTLVASEVFVVNDALGAAGTFDGVWRDRDGLHYVGDKKTGRDYPGQLAVQLAAYADASRYDPVTGQRSPILPGVRWAGEVLAISIPRGQGVTRVRSIPLDDTHDADGLPVRGARWYARAASQVHRARRVEQDLLRPW